MDDDGQSSELLGHCESTVGAIVGARNQTLILDLVMNEKHKKNNLGKIILRCENV